MQDIITVTGMVAQDPRSVTTSEGLAIASFRLVSTQRRFDRETSQWVDVGSNWFTVSAFRGLAGNVVASLAKLDRVVVTGRLRIRPWTSGERNGISVEIDAEAIGHDLTWGTSAFTRTLGRARIASAEQAEREEGGPDGSGDAHEVAQSELDRPFSAREEAVPF